MSKRVRESEFYDDLLEFSKFIRRLRDLSKKILSLVISNLIVYSLSAFTYDNWNLEFFNIELKTIYLSMIVILSFTGIYLLSKFSKVRTRAIFHFNELSDEVDWKKENRKKFIYRKPIEMREISRELAISTDLPFTSNSNGQLFYLIIFVFMIIGMVVIQFLK